ncbi:uncharacterized protein LOC135165602 [Diachasmimorpha longicaudata]|uniref:uncharacterized protein LOC135165602 n=1 Tax=Diachasmimorpha longicaudata TaxID=58733 RepID=UPI0030B909CE
MDKTIRYERENINECCDDVPTCSQDINIGIERKRSRPGRRCPSPDVLAQLQASDNPDEIQLVLNEVRNGRITQAVEFIFSLRPFLKDRGKILIDSMERDLADFRKLVDETVDYRVQDEGDVMHFSQNAMNEKLHHLTMQMKERTLSIMEKLHKISPKFDWKNDGKDMLKLSTLINIKEKNTGELGPKESVDSTKNLIHQIFIRNQWLKRELHRLQEENNDLRIYFKKSKDLAAERRVEQIQVPRMLAEQQEMLEKRLDKLKAIYHKNAEKIHALHVNYEEHIHT